MSLLRKFLFPFSLLFAVAQTFRNFLYDYDIITNSKFYTPTISIGNLSFGGTGKTPMVGYLNAPSPFDNDGWYDTKDMVEQDGDFYKITGRIGEVINVGGLKFMASEVELAAMSY